MEEVWHTLQKYGTKTLQLYKCVPSRSLSVYGDCLQGRWWCIVWLCFNSAFAWVPCQCNDFASISYTFWPPHRHTLSPTSFRCYALFHLSSSSFLFPSGNYTLKWKLKYVPVRRGYTYCIMLSHCCHVLCQVYSVVVSYIPMNAYIKPWDDDYKRCAFRICEWHNIAIGDNYSEHRLGFYYNEFPIILVIIFSRHNFIDEMH